MSLGKSLDAFCVPSGNPSAFIGDGERQSLVLKWCESVSPPCSCGMRTEGSVEILFSHCIFRCLSRLHWKKLWQYFFSSLCISPSKFGCGCCDGFCRTASCLVPIDCHPELCSPGAVGRRSGSKIGRETRKTFKGSDGKKKHLQGFQPGNAESCDLEMFLTMCCSC